MRNILKSLVKGVLSKTSFRLVRAPQNRFQSIEDCLWQLKRLGYDPKVVIDGGAHLGDFSMLAHRVFPDAAIHMIEPQPACKDALAALAARHRFKFHPFALVSAEEVGTPVIMTAGREPSTGSHVVPPADRKTADIMVESATLDQLFASAVNRSDQVLLKLDLQGYELAALRGAVDMFKSVEVLLTEVSFFAQAYEPSIAQLISFLFQNGLEMYDVAALSGRARDNRLRQGDLLFVRTGTVLTTDTAWA